MNALRPRTLPLAVSLKRFLAPEWVFILGMAGRLVKQTAASGARRRLAASGGGVARGARAPAAALERLPRRGREGVGRALGARGASARSAALGLSGRSGLAGRVGGSRRGGARRSPSAAPRPARRRWRRRRRRRCASRRRSLLLAVTAALASCLGCSSSPPRAPPSRARAASSCCGRPGPATARSTAISESSPARRSSSAVPRSGCVTSRPRNMIVILTLSLPLRKRRDVALLRVVVVLRDLRAELDLADRDLLLVLAGRLLLLGLLVLVLRVVEHAADGRTGIRSDLDEVEIALLGVAQAPRRSSRPRSASRPSPIEAHLGHANPVVDPSLVALWRAPVEPTRDRH